MSKFKQDPTRVPRLALVMGAVLLMVGVAAGAFGAHALKASASPEMLAIWQTAVLYQLIHGLGILVTVALRTVYSSRLMAYAASFMGGGVLIFSGSLYMLVLTDLRWLGAITPIGGLSFIVAWALVAWSAWQAS